jgi:CRISPR-associated protein Csd2
MIMIQIEKRYDFALIFDVKDGNPNGDPDAGNLPRVDAETGCGLVTDVCLKRKVRNFVQMTNAADIFVKERAVLNLEIENVYAEIGVDLSAPPSDEKDGKKRNKDGVGQGSEVTSAKSEMCKRFFDIRTFGAVMSTGPNAGQVRGPVQITFGRSVDPIVSLEHSITVCAARKKEDPIEAQIGIQGRKNTVPYGLYVAHGFVSAHLAAQTGFSGEDLELLWTALEQMFEHDRSAARGLMSTQKLIIFEHEGALGSASAQSQFARIGIEAVKTPPRCIDDYKISLDGVEVPKNKVRMDVPVKR